VKTFLGAPFVGPFFLTEGNRMIDIRTQIRRQIELEEEGLSLGASRYHARQLPWRTEAGSIEEESNLPPGRQLLKTIIGPSVEAIEAFIAAACSGKAGRRHNVVDFMLLSEPHELAYLASRCLVNATSSHTTLQNCAVSVANAVIENVEYKAFAEINRKGYKGFLKAQERA
jgi:DNA-directed RNA polymerase